MYCWMHLKSISEMPSLIESAVTPVPSVFDTTAGPVVVVPPLPEAADVGVPPPPDLLLLPHAAATSVIATTSVTKNRRPFMPTSPGWADHKRGLTRVSGIPARRGDQASSTRSRRSSDQ